MNVSMSLLLVVTLRRFDHEHYLCCLLLSQGSRASSIALRALNVELAQVSHYLLCKMYIDFCQSSTNNSRVCPNISNVPSQHFGTAGSSVANQIARMEYRCPSFGRIHCKVWTLFFCFNPPYSSCEKGCDIFLVWFQVKSHGRNPLARISNNYIDTHKMILSCEKLLIEVLTR